MSQAIVIVQGGGPNIVVRVIYFLLIGWWLGAIVSALGWLLNVTIIGLPLGLYLLNRLPSIITLRPQESGYHVEGGVIRQGQQQRGFLLRAIYFLLIGWWFSGLWIIFAYACLILILTIPISFWAYGKVGAVTTLYRS